MVSATISFSLIQACVHRATKKVRSMNSIAPITRCTERCMSFTCCSGDELKLLSQGLGVFVYYLLLCLGLVFLSAERVTQFSIVLVSFQQLINAARKMNPYLNDGFLKESLQYLKVITFEFEYVRPGCTYPTISAPMVFILELIYSCLLASVFVCAALLYQHRTQNKPPRQTWKQNKTSLSFSGEALPAGAVSRGDGLEKNNQTEDKPSRCLLYCQRFCCKERAWVWQPTRPRVKLALVLCFLVFYLELSTKSISMLSCSSSADREESLVLDADSVTRCFVGSHIVASIAAIGILLMLLGLPLYWAYVLFRAAKTNKLSEGEIASSYFVLLRRLKDRFWYFRLLTIFFMDFMLALVSYNSSVLLQVIHLLSCL